jgi:hypothetical protein
MSAVLPRIFLILFRYSQAVLINVTIQYVKRDTTAGTKSDTGYWLVIAALIVYLGMAVTFPKRLCFHLLNLSDFYSDISTYPEQTQNYGQGFFNWTNTSPVNGCSEWNS